MKKNYVVVIEILILVAIMAALLADYSAVTYVDGVPYAVYD